MYHYPQLNYRSVNDGSLYNPGAPCPELQNPAPGIVWLDRDYVRAKDVPDESHIVVDDDLVTARSASDINIYFNTVVNKALKKGL